MSLKQKKIDQIQSLLLKARPESNGTEAERSSARLMAFKLMEQHGITKDELVKKPSPKYKPGPDRTQQYRGAGAPPPPNWQKMYEGPGPNQRNYTFGNGRYYMRLPKAMASTDFTKSLIKLFELKAKVEGYEFEVSVDGDFVRSTSYKIMVNFEKALLQHYNELLAERNKRMEAQRQRRVAEEAAKKKQADAFGMIAAFCAAVLVTSALINIIF